MVIPPPIKGYVIDKFERYITSEDLPLEKSNIFTGNLSSEVLSNADEILQNLGIINNSLIMSLYIMHDLDKFKNIIDEIFSSHEKKKNFIKL